MPTAATKMACAKRLMAEVVEKMTEAGNLFMQKKQVLVGEMVRFRRVAGASETGAQVSAGTRAAP